MAALKTVSNGDGSIQVTFGKIRVHESAGLESKMIQKAEDVI
jgi:hypothetical protein